MKLYLYEWSLDFEKNLNIKHIDSHYESYFPSDVSKIWGVKKWKKFYDLWPPCFSL
jgi:hypothetical protein